MKVFDKIYKRFRWELHKHWDGIYKHLCFTPYVMKYDECIDYINRNHASLARIGDGELICMYGRDLNFQKSTPKLQQGLRRVCESEGKNCLIGIPDSFEHLERYNQVEQSFWKSHFYFNRRKWYSFLKKDIKYASTYLSRFYSMEYDKELTRWRLSKLVTLWQDRDVLLIEGKDSKLCVGNNLLDNARSVRRIIGPSKNAFDRYNEILSAAKSHATVDDLIIIALGPTATVLAFDFSEAGYQALDLGHFDIEYEWYRMGVTEKVPVKGKFSNEAAILKLADSEVVGELKSKSYEQQIIATIQ